MKSIRKRRTGQLGREELLDKCLAAFIKAGTLDLSLDGLAEKVGASKRMLVHYFRGRVPIEKLVMTRLEDRLRAQFNVSALPKGITLKEVMRLLWEHTSQPAARGTLLLVMSVTQRAWHGSKRAREFYREQQRLWTDMLLAFCPERTTVDAALQLFQGATLTFLVTGNREQGRQAIEYFLAKGEDE